MTPLARSTLLLAIHYQNEVVHPGGKIRVGIAEASSERAAILAAAKRLIDGARAAGVPVISVRIAFPDHGAIAANAPIWRRVVAAKAMAEGSWGAEFYDGLGPLPGEPVVTHRRNDPFFASSLAETVASFRPRRLIVAGVSTTYVVESAVRTASDLGYEVVVAADACSAASPAMHEASLKAMAELAEITTVNAALAELRR